MVKITLNVDAVKYDSESNKYSIRFNDVRLLQYIVKDDTNANIMLQFDGDQVSDIPNLSEIDSILDEVDSVRNKHQKTQPQPTVKTLDRAARVQLFHSIMNGDIDYIKQCIIDGLITDVNEPVIPQGNWAPLPMLAFAVSQGQYEICAMLVSLGANHAGTQSLWWAINDGHYHIERLLIMSSFGGSASHNITDAIRKTQFKTSICHKMNHSDIMNDDWFDTLINYMCFIIKQRRAFSDDMMMMCWHYICKTNTTPLQSTLWKCLIGACQQIIQSGTKNEWFWLNQYMLKSGIWLQDHPINKQAFDDTAGGDKPKVWRAVRDESDIKRMTIKELLFIELYDITVQQAKIEGTRLTSLETANKKIWNMLCKYHIETGYENTIVRQDVISGGLKPLKTKQELMSNITPTYNPILFYDLEQYLPSLISIAYNVNDEFQQCMREIFKIDPITNQSQSTNLEKTKIVNTHYRSGPVKLITRCKAKVANEYFTTCEFPSAAHLLDINRCLLTFPDVTAMLNGLKLFQNAIKNKKSGCISEIVRIKNGFSLYDSKNPNYADIKLNVIIKARDGNVPIIGEVQFLFEAMQKFKMISHKLYGILRLEEEFNNLCQVMPALMSFEKEYQFLQCTKDSKALNRLIVEHDQDPAFLIAGLHMKNLCNHNGVKVLKVLAQFIPKTMLNHAIEAQSALRKACGAKKLEMVEYLVNNFDISMDEARVAYSVCLSNGVQPITKVLEDKFGKAQLTSSSSALSNAISYDNTYLYSMELPVVDTRSMYASPIMIQPKRNGVVLWLDATDKNTLKLDGKSLSSWQCKVNKDNRLVGNDSRPYLRALPDMYCGEGVFFDFDHTSTFTNPVTNIRTICSLHSMENSRPHKSLGSEDGGAKENFYILTSAAHFSFHGATSKEKICASNWAHKSFQDGTIRLDCVKKEIKVKDCKSFPSESKIAILSLNDNITDVKFDRIGRDRVYHHFSGSIIELIIFDRVLDGNEKMQIENYLVYKHFGAVVKTIYAQCRKVNLISYCANYLIALLYGNHILQKFIQKQ
eukprot:256180_1